MEKKSYFEDEWMLRSNFHVVSDFRWNVAMHVIGHCALIAGKTEGEDRAGRTAYKFLSPDEVAGRALAIADEMVNQASDRGWFKEPTVTDEQRFKYSGLLEKIKLYGGYSEDNEKIAKVMEDIAKLTA